MKGRSTLRKLDAELRREVEIAGAIAREDVLDLHIRLALELVELGRGSVESVRMLEIYARVHTLDPTTAVIVRNRALALLGQARGELEEWTLDPDAQPARPRSILALLRLRLRGRVHRELRQWVELHTGRTEVALLQRHAAHAERVARICAKRGIGVADAVAHYAELVRLRKDWGEMVYFFTLSRLSQNSGPWAAPASPQLQAESAPVEEALLATLPAQLTATAEAVRRRAV